jgi:hypothetical protein
MRKNILLVFCGVALVIAGYSFGSRNTSVAHASEPVQGTVPKSYGHLVTAISDQIGTGLIFEDADGVIRFVAMTGMKEGELARYDQTPTHGGIPKSYGHLVAAVANPNGTGLVFEDSQGVIRFVTITGKDEGELTRN